MKKINILLLTLLLAFCASACLAQEEEKKHYQTGGIEKLARGLSNIGTGWIELPATINRNFEDHGYIAGTFYGIPEGLVRALIRTSVGIYETITFPLPIPKDYEPILEPEFVSGLKADGMERVRP